MGTSCRKHCSQGLAHVNKHLSLFRSGRSSINTKLTLYKALIRSVMTYDCSTWQYAMDAHLLKLQRLRNRVLRATGNLDKCTSVRELRVAFKIPYVCNYITNYSRHRQE
jgi:hypothetical protein